MAQAFHQDSSFKAAETGDLEVVLDEIIVRKAALALMLGTKES